MMRYSIHHDHCVAGQQHDTHMFNTDCAGTAQAWLSMGCFVAFDNRAGQLCYLPDDVPLYAALHP